MLLKKVSIYILLVSSIVIFFNTNILFSKEVGKDSVMIYLNEFSKQKEFSATFLQSSDGMIEEGLLHIQNQRLRIEYISPKKILIILAEDKAMYFNKDLEELEYFNPQKNQAKIFFDIFFKKNYFENSLFSEKEKVVELNKKIFLEGSEVIDLKIIFEKKPTLIRKIEIKNNNEVTTYSISDHNFHPSFDKKMFSMASPLSN